MNMTMAKFWVQPEIEDGRLIGYGIYRMEDTGKPECYECFAGPANVSEADLAETLQLATDYCSDLNKRPELNDAERRALNDAESRALDNFRRCYGRRWKRELEIYWYNARIWEDDNGDKEDGYILHGLRNSHGPTWLAANHFTDLRARPMKKYRVECYRTHKAEYGEFLIEAPNQMVAIDIANERLRSSPETVEWTPGNDEVDEVGISAIVLHEE
jgi:hypothetical protein